MEGDLKITQIQRSKKVKTWKSGGGVVVSGLKREGLEEKNIKPGWGGFGWFEYKACGLMWHVV